MTMNAPSDHSAVSQLVNEEEGGYALNLVFGVSDHASLGIAAAAAVEPTWSKFGLCIHIDDE